MVYKEWNNVFNPFNSMKALYWHDQLLAMSKGETPVPVCATIDPTNICNLNCSFCIWDKFRNARPDTIPDEVLLALPKFLKDWGVISVCVGGGGEPFMHPKIAELFIELHNVGMPTGTISNGLALDNQKSREAVVDTCRWIGFSIDAATIETYRRIKNPYHQNAFIKVIDNIRWIASHRRKDGRPTIGMKFCMTRQNYLEIYDFAKLAKETGADEVHFRPVYIPGYVFPAGIADEAQRQILRAREDFEDGNFNVYGIFHKFDDKIKRAIRFKTCRATPINAYFMADGTLGLCCDRRDDQALNLGTYYPFDNVIKKWGSPEHKEMLSRITPQTCPRCTQSITNEIIEKVIIEDQMCVEFV